MANNLHRARPVKKPPEPLPVSLRVIMKRLKIDDPSNLLDFARRVRDVESSGGTKKVNPNSNARGIYQWMTSDFGKGEKKGTIESATHNLIKSYNKEGIEIPDWLLSLDRNAEILRQNEGYIKTLTQEDWQNQVLDLKPHMEDALFWSYLDQQPGTDEKWLTITYGNDTPWPKKNDKPRYWAMLDTYIKHHHRGGEKVEKEKFRDVNIRKKFGLPAYHKDENPFQPALPMSDIRLDEELHAPYQLYELPTLLNEKPILRGTPEDTMNTGLKSLQKQSDGQIFEDIDIEHWTEEMEDTYRKRLARENAEREETQRAYELSRYGVFPELFEDIDVEHWIDPILTDYDKVSEKDRDKLWSSIPRHWRQAYSLDDFKQREDYWRTLRQKEEEESQRLWERYYRGKALAEKHRNAEILSTDDAIEQQLVTIPEAPFTEDDLRILAPFTEDDLRILRQKEITDAAIQGLGYGAGVYVDDIIASDLNLPHNRKFGGLVSLANGGNPYVYEDIVEDAMYESPQESYEYQDYSSQEETPLPYNLATTPGAPLIPVYGGNVNPDYMALHPNYSIVEDLAQARQYSSPLNFVKETSPATLGSPMDIRPTSLEIANYNRLRENVAQRQRENDDQGINWKNVGLSALKNTGKFIGSGLVNALTGIPVPMVWPMATVGRGMFQHHKNIRDYGRDYRDNADIVAQLKEQGKFVDIEGPSREWWDDDSEEEYSSPWRKTPNLGLRYLDQPFNEPEDMRYGVYKAGGLISLQGGGNPIANNFTQHIREGINSGIRSMVANAYAQGNVPPPSSPQLTQSQLLNQGLTMAPNTANRPVPQQPHAQSNISNVYAQSTQPQSYYMQPNQIR